MAQSTAVPEGNVAKEVQVSVHIYQEFMNKSFVTQSTAVPKGNVAKEVQVLPKFFVYSICIERFHCPKLRHESTRIKQPEKKYHFQTKYSHTIW